MNTVERVKAICKERKIPIYKLEQECGFANGYIGQLKKGTIPDVRLRKIAEFLDMSMEYLMTGEEAPTDGYYISTETARVVFPVRIQVRRLPPRHQGTSRSARS